MFVALKERKQGLLFLKKKRPAWGSKKTFDSLGVEFARGGPTPREAE
jgi:hypothetical protein